MSVRENTQAHLANRFREASITRFGVEGIRTPWLRSQGVDTVVVCGLYAHACVRAAVLGAYQRGFAVIMATDAIGSDLPEFAQQTFDWLGARSATLMSNADILAKVR